MTPQRADRRTAPPVIELRNLVKTYAMGDNTNDILYELPFALEGQRDLAVESMYEYGSRAGIWRLFRIFDRNHLGWIALVLTLGALAMGDRLIYRDSFEQAFAELTGSSAPAKSALAAASPSAPAAVLGAGAAGVEGAGAAVSGADAFGGGVTPLKS